MTSFIVSPPPAFNINDVRVEERFMDYKKQFLTFMKANDIISKSDTQKIAIFKAYCGDDLREQVEADETEDDSFDDVLQRLQDHYEPVTNLLQQRFNFFIRRQRANERFDKYLIELKKIVKNCNFGDMEESMMKVVLIMNMRDATAQQNLLKDAESKKLETLISDFRKFDAENQNNKENNKILNQKQNSFPQQQQQNQQQKSNDPSQAQKQNNSQPQKQKAQPSKENNPQKQNPPKQNNTPKQNPPNQNPPKENNSQKQNPPKEKQNQDSKKKESQKNANDNGPNKSGNDAPKNAVPKKKNKPQQSQPQQTQPQTESGDSTSILAQLADRIKNLSS